MNKQWVRWLQKFPYIVSATQGGLTVYLITALRLPISDCSAVPMYDHDLWTGNCYRLYSLHHITAIMSIYLFYLILLGHRSGYLTFKRTFVAWPCERLHNQTNKYHFGFTRIQPTFLAKLESQDAQACRAGWCVGYSISSICVCEASIVWD